MQIPTIRASPRSLFTKNYAVRGTRVDGDERSGGIACGRVSSMCLGEGVSSYVRSFMGL